MQSPPQQLWARSSRRVNFLTRKPDTRVVCVYCKTREHVKEHCPLPDRQWRAYRATLVQNEEKPDYSKVFCPNCAKVGHSVYDCTEKRTDPSEYDAYAYYIGYIYRRRLEQRPGWDHSVKIFKSKSKEDDGPRAKRMKFN